MVRLRAAARTDAAQLFRWRVDAETVRNSIAPPPASIEDHGQWLDTVLCDASVALYVAYDEERGVDVGSVRLDRRAGAGEVEMSITVAPEERGRGYSHHLIARAIEMTADVRLVAHVKASNTRSLGAFRALGFRTVGGDELLRLVREPAQLNRGAEA